MTLLPVVSPEVCQERMGEIFNRHAFKPSLSGPLAGRAISGLIWAGCVVEDDAAELAVDLQYARPSTVIWMNEELVAVDDEERRAAWYKVSKSTKARTQALMESWGVETKQWYADNTRETLRDDIYHELADHGAMRRAPHLDTTSSKAQWILGRDFAELFDPSLVGEELQEAIDVWIEKHMSNAAKVRSQLVRKRAKASAGVIVTLPDGTTRALNPGNSSLILKAVIEQWAPKRLGDPAVLTISESGDKVHVGDQSILNAIGININVSDLLPDALLVDLAADPLELWIIEAVATDGPISERRKELFEEWAEQQELSVESLRYLTAFLGRRHPAAKASFPQLAAGTHAWYMDEPDQELTWETLAPAPASNIIRLRS